MNPLDLVGHRFGRLVVLRRDGSYNGKTLWIARCDCGVEATVPSDRLRGRKTRSCGCLSREMTEKGRRHFIHGMTGTGLYRIWSGMISRCMNPKSEGYRKYGARGIVVHPPWRVFVNFMRYVIRYLGERPSVEYSIDRIDNDGGYVPGNIRWATISMQQRNKRTNRMLTVRGRTMCITDWAKESGIERTTITQRLRRGWSVEEAVDAALRPPPSAP